MDRVVTTLQSYVVQKDATADNILQIAQIYLNNGRLAEAVSTMQLLIARYPQDPRGYYGLAIVAAAQHRVDDVVALLGKAIAINPQVRSQLAGDPQFSALRDNPRFKQLVSPSP
jgi:Flp pilus assembly protein TadD